VWYEEHGSLDRAIEHALHAQDYLHAADLIERAFGAALARGRITPFLQWIRALPEDLIGKRPRLCTYWGWSMFLNGQYAQAEEALTRAKEVLHCIPPSEARDVMRGELGSMLATMATLHQDVPTAIHEAQTALVHLPADRLPARARATRALGIAYGLRGDTDRLVEVCLEARSLAIESGNLLLAAEVISQIGFMQFHQGKLRQAARSYQEIVDLVEHPARFPPAGLGHIGLALISLEWNDLDAVETHLERGIELCQLGGIGYALRPAYCAQAILKQAQGDTEGALQAMDRAIQLPWVAGSADIALQLADYQVRLQLMRGDVETAARWIEGDAVAARFPDSQGPPFDALPPVLAEVYQIAMARVHLARGEWERVQAIHDRVCDVTQRAGRMARAIEISLLQALALQARGQIEAALVSLERCLAWAEPEGYLRLFLEAGQDLPALLRLALGRGIHSDYVRTLLAALEDPTAGSRTTSKESALPGESPPQGSPLTRSLVEPLTPRERQVLQLIGDGLSNQQISERLVVSLNTVKKHTSNIYSKLDVRSRTQALARAQELGLM
jgi:LuxR family maltose regulon positive regulatory protein